MFYVYVQQYGYSIDAGGIFKQFIGRRFAKESSEIILIETPWVASNERRHPTNPDSLHAFCTGSCIHEKNCVKALRSSTPRHTCMI